MSSTGQGNCRQPLNEDGSFKANSFGKLFSGNWKDEYPSQSEADLELVKRLARFTESNEVVWDAFRMSVLGQRGKADRVDYRKRTLTAARAHLANDALAIAHGKIIADAVFWRLQLGQSERAEPIRKPTHFTLLSDDDLGSLAPLSWMVKHVIPDAGVGAIYGASGTFKSFLTLDLLAHISSGKDWFGRRVKAAPAVYVPFEGRGGVPNRIKAWRLAQTAVRNPEILFTVVPAADVRSNVAVIMEPLNLRDQNDRDRLVKTLLDCGWAGGVLCIDTLAHASQGLDENSSQMSEMIAILGELQRRLGGVVLVVHHSGKVLSAGMRGWSGIHAAMDFVIECGRVEGKGKFDAQFSLTKVKDGESGQTCPFSMRAVQLGMDDDGEQIISLVVNPPVANDKAGKSEGQCERTVEAQADAEDDDFVWEWVKVQEAAGEYPTGRSLEGQRTKQMKSQRGLTQKRLRDAIARLKAASRLVDADVKAPSGNSWMRAVELPGPGPSRMR